MPRYNTRSRLRMGRYVLLDGFAFFDLLQLPEIPEQADDLVYQVQGRKRIDQVAFDVYREARLWWVIAVANDMELVPNDLSSGDVLRVPSPRYVFGELFRRFARF